MNTVRAAQVFFAFAFAYFFSALLRAVTATLAPAFSSELGLHAADLGLLAGAYFFGFALMQLPLGHALDRLGPRRVLAAMLALALLGCAGFALADELPMLVAARALIGVGVAACLMAPLTAFRRLFSSSTQLRATSWLLMTGSLGMVASTLPVQFLLPRLGWRGLFWLVAALLAVAIAVILLWVPRDPSPEPAAQGPAEGTATGAAKAAAAGGYRGIVRHPMFIRLAPLGFTVYGGLIAVQSLWAGPWLTRVSGWSAAAAAQGLFVINLCMLFTFMTWGALMPRLMRRGIGAMQLITWGVPLSLALLGMNVLLGAQATALNWAAWCVSSTVMSLSLPAIGQVFPPALAGRALSALNLTIFGGVFCIQWGIGLVVDALVAQGTADGRAFQIAFGLFWLACAGAYLVFLMAPRVRADNDSTRT